MKLDSLINFAKDGVSRFRSPADEIELDFLVNEIKKYNRGADFELLKGCYEYGKKQHQGEIRKSGEPFFVHCVETAKTLIDLNMDMYTICSGLLHDTIEDTDTTREELAELFDSKIADLVEGVTKVTQIGTKHFHGTKEETQAETYRKMLLAMAKDVRVILIKLADRLHNMRTLEYHNTDKQYEKALETLEIYAPLAHRLGIAQIKCELEDLSFKHLNPEEYKNIANLVNQSRAEREEYTAKMAKEIHDVLKKKKLDSIVFGRPKHLYSIYQKIHRKGVPFKDICDLIAFRVLVDTVDECYIVLGALHEKWNPMPERVKFFIGPLAKTNGYQSLHTTILDKGRPVEIQIRTHEMHQVAEKGIAAHWRYKEGIPAQSENDQPFVWLRDFVEHIQELKEPEQFLQSMKDDLFPDEVYVFTPQGDVVALPVGSSPLDLAYKIHTELGNTCVGAVLMNEERFVPLRYRLQNGEQIKIITEKNATPSRDWLNFVKTGRARNKIRRWLREQEKTKSLETGKQLLENEFRRRYFDAKIQMKSPDLLKIAESMELHSINDLLVQVGYGDVSAQHVVNLIEQYVLSKLEQTLEDEFRNRNIDSKFQIKKEDLNMVIKTLELKYIDDLLAQIANENISKQHIISLIFPTEEKDEEDTDSEEDKKEPVISIAGVDHAFARIAKCCNPIPGDEVVGFLTRGRGVSIHRVKCDTIQNELERIVQVNWNPLEEVTYPVEIWIESNDRKGLLADISAAITKEDVNIEKGDFWQKNYTTSYQRMVIAVKDVQHLERVIKAIEKIPGVRKVMRKGEDKK